MIRTPFVSSCICGCLALISVGVQAIKLERWPENISLQTDGLPVHFQGSVVSPSRPPQGTLMRVSSNVPVVLNRLIDGFYSGATPSIVGPLISVKSNCVDILVDVQVEEIANATLLNASSQTVTHIIIEADPVSNSSSFFESITLDANYPCQTFCQTTDTRSPTSSPFQIRPQVGSSTGAIASLVAVALLSVVLTIFLATESTKLSTVVSLFTIVPIVMVALLVCGSLGQVTAHPTSELNGRELQETTQQCQVNAEIVYYGCHREALVTAPIVRLRNSHATRSMENAGAFCVNGFQSSKCRDTIQFTEIEDTKGRPDTSNTIVEVGVDGAKSQFIPATGSWNCDIAVGRPFRTDPQEQPVTASATTKGSPEWSTRLSEINLEDFRMEAYQKDPRDTYRSGSLLANEWTHRALGEHASIASFATFTIALLTNQAPPDLIRDALQAAQEERSHAEISFAVASLLSGESVEPSALPPSSINLEANLTSLAMSTAKEGCIAETLSALTIAAAVDSVVKDGVNELELFLAEQTRPIILEEAGHSALAWRTIHWICSVDSLACQSVLTNVLNTDVIAMSAASQLVGSPRAQLAWECAYDSLLPLIRAHTMDKMEAGSSSACNIVRGGESLLSEVVERIQEDFLQDPRVPSPLSTS